VLLIEKLLTTGAAACGLGRDGECAGPARVTWARVADRKSVSTCGLCQGGCRMEGGGMGWEWGEGLLA
jgi:hypothetical protein